MALRLDMTRVFQQLNMQQRQMMWLAHVEGADHREIAAALGLREGSVRVLLHRARRKLASLLQAVTPPRGTDG
jgi:RNA polymerase sigma-70 factor (ECF subfamily)